MRKRVVRRAQARIDAEVAADHYLAEGGDDLAEAFVAAFEQAIDHIAAFAATGSPRYATRLRMSALRFWRLDRFPYLVFYLDLADCVMVIRLLHEKRDLPRLLSGN